MTNAELAILSLIAEAPRHGYELEQIIEARGMRDWTDIGFSSIYYLLNKLEKEGLVEKNEQPAEGSGPNRKVFSITPAGREQHQLACLETLSSPQRQSAPLLLGLASLPMLPRPQVLAALNDYKVSLQTGLDQMLNNADQQEPLPPFIRSMFTYSQQRIQSEMDWVANFIQDMEDRNV